MVVPEASNEPLHPHHVFMLGLVAKQGGFCVHCSPRLSLELGLK